MFLLRFCPAAWPRNIKMYKGTFTLPLFPEELPNQQAIDLFYLYLWETDEVHTVFPYKN